MGKKNDKSKEAAATAVVEKKPAKAIKPAVKKKAVKKSPATGKKPAFTNDDIALRAYFIAEKRHKSGHHGDTHQDWLEAERQLLAESKKKPAAAKIAKKP